MEVEDTIGSDFIDKLSSLERELEFYGTVSFIEKVDHYYNIYIDLFNKTTNDIDDNLIINGRLNNITYSFELVIKTPNLSVFGHKNKVFKFNIIKSIINHFDTYEGTISFFTNHKYDRFNPLFIKNEFFQVSSIPLEETNVFKKRIDGQISDLENFIRITDNYKIEYFSKDIKTSNVRYSQYHVGIGNCSYINIKGISKGFFNIGYCNQKDYKKLPYSGFSRHRPDWIILSNTNKSSYSAAIRYGNHNTFSCIWILPMIIKYNVNLIRLLYCIKNANGQIIMLKYKANSSVCSLVKDDIKLSVYYTTEYDINNNGLSLYIENKDKFISLGNSDYNFLTKSMIRQKFDIIVLPFSDAKRKTKIHLNRKPIKDYDQYSDSKTRIGYQVYRTDRLGNFFCKI